MFTALLPIGDDNSDRVIKPFITYALIALNIAVFLLLQLQSEAFTSGFSVVPAEILSGKDIVASSRSLVLTQGPSPVFLTIFSAMFMHGGWAHLGGNLLFL